MKKIQKSVFLALLTVLLLGLCSCGGDFEYSMKSERTGVLTYSIPEHFAISEHEDADAFYITLNSNVLVYTYTHREFRDAFDSYGTDVVTAMSAARHIVEVNEYNCIVKEGSLEGSATFSFMYSAEDENTYYSTSIVVADEENVCLLMFSCNADKLEMYNDMIIEILASPRIDGE